MTALPPEVIAAGGAVAAVGIAAAYAYLTGRDTSVSADVDADGDDEVSFVFEGSDTPDVAEELVAAGRTEKTDDIVIEQAPQEVRDIGTDLPQVTGIGETRADALNKAGFHTAADLYFATDEELTAVKGIGNLTVEQVRDDIGSGE